MTFGIIWILLLVLYFCGFVSSLFRKDWYSSSVQELKMSKASTMAKYVKERVVLSSLLSRYADLTPVGEYSFKTACLFHKDNNPSMLVNDVPITSPYFYCFSCGESGDFIKLLSKMANVSSGVVLGSSFSALQKGKTVEEWISSFEKKYGIVASQHSLIPRSSFISRNRPAKKIDRDHSEDSAISEDEALKFNRDIVLDTLFQAKSFFATRLIMDPNAYFVRSYLKDRGISVATAMKFELGYAPTMRLLKKAQVPSSLPASLAPEATTKNQSSTPDKPIVPISNSLLKQSLGETFKQWQSMRGQTVTDWLLHDVKENSEEHDSKLQYMVHAGLTVNAAKYLVAQDSQSPPAGAPSLHRRQTHYDRFRNRLMIPIRNQEGKVIGFGGRELPLPRNLMTDDELKMLDEETKLKKPVAKYINSPSSVVFTKKKVLFGLDMAAPHCEKEGYVIMVEGYFDVIACYQAGIRNVVAAMGTSVTIEQLLLAAQLTTARTIILLLDNDAAGEKASLRAKRLVDKHHDKVQRLLRPDGDTIDEEEIQRKHYITLKRATIELALPFIQKYEIETEKGVNKVFDPTTQKLKDCADICELFSATNARKIIRHIAKSATLVEDDDIEESKVPVKKIVGVCKKSSQEQYRNVSVSKQIGDSLEMQTSAEDFPSLSYDEVV